MSSQTYQRNTFTPEQAALQSCKANASSVLCDGPKCMKWRWAVGPKTHAFDQEVIRRVKADETGKMSATKAYSELLTEIKKGKHPGFPYTEGYCGLGGDPVRSPRP